MSEVSEGSSFDIGDLPFAKICSLLGPFFNSNYYTDRYPDMAKGLVDPLEHYAIFGWKKKDGTRVTGSPQNGTSLRILTLQQRASTRYYTT